MNELVKYPSYGRCKVKEKEGKGKGKGAGFES